MKFRPYLLLNIFLSVLIGLQTIGVVPIFAQEKTSVEKNRPQNKTETNDRVELRRKAFEFLQSGNWQNARTIFEEILAESPNDYFSSYGNGVALFNLQHILEADVNVQKAIDFLTKSNANNAILADALVLSAVISAKRNENGAAIEKLQKAVKIAPDNFDANFSLGRAYFGNSDISNAVKFFQQAARIQPNNLRALFFLATALERIGNLQEALKQYRAVVKLDENYAEGNLGLGVLLINLESEKSVEGLKALQKAVSVNGNLYEARLSLGKTLIKLDRAEEAIGHLIKASELAAKNPEPHYQLALAYRKIGKKAEAAAEMEIVKQIHETRRGTAKKDQ